MSTDDLMAGLRELRENVNPKGREIIDRAMSLVSIDGQREKVFQAACDFVGTEGRNLSRLFNTDVQWVRLRDAVYQFAHLETVEGERVAPDPARSGDAYLHGQVIDGPDAGNLISASVPVWRYVAEISMDIDGPECEPARQKVEGWYRIEGGGWRWIPGYRADEMLTEMKRRGIADDRLIDVLIEGSVQGYLDGIDAADEAESYQPPTREEIEAVAIDPSKFVEKVRHSGPDTESCVLCRSGYHERVEQPTFPSAPEVREAPSDLLVIGNTGSYVAPFDPDHPGCAPEICGGTKSDPCRWVVRTDGRAHDDDLLDEMRKAGIPSSRLDEVIDAGGADYYLAVTDLEQHRDQRLVPADRLVEGDEIYSPQTDQWYPVVSAETRDGITVVMIEGGFKFRVTTETEYSTKPGETHRAILASGLDVEGVVKSS